MAAFLHQLESVLMVYVRFMIMGPHQAYGNKPRSIEYATLWITEAIRYFEDHGITYAEATKDSVETWTKRK